MARVGIIVFAHPRQQRDTLRANGSRIILDSSMAGTSTGINIHDVLLCYLNWGFGWYSEVDSPYYVDLWNCQFVQCNNGNDMSWGLNLGLHNILYTGPTTALTATSGANDYKVHAEHVTADVTAFGVTPDPSWMTNSIVLESSGPTATIISNSVVTRSPALKLFQTVGAGSYYLTNGSPYRHAGTPNISPTLLAGLSQKTTWPPLVYSNTTFSVATNFSPQARRDTNAAPDLGYHYDPIDYFFGGATANSNVTFTAGTAFGWFPIPGSSWTAHGISLANDAVAAFNGTESAPCVFAHCATVQEGNGAWVGNGGSGGIVSGGTYDPTNPSQLIAQFTRFSNLSFGMNFCDGPGNQALLIHGTDCELVQPSGGYTLMLAFTNCLFYRSGIGHVSSDSAYSFEGYREIYRNCTFYGGSLNLYHWESAPFWRVLIRDCAFDGTSLDFAPPSTWDWTWLDSDYNATNNVTFIQEANLTALLGAHNVYPPGGFNWQASWLGGFYLPTNSLLVDKGSTSALSLGLYYFTTQTNQVIEAGSTVDIGYHYVATGANGNPIDSNNDGIPNYLDVIPLWQAADPLNLSKGALNIWIDSPANGAVLQ